MELIKQNIEHLKKICLQHNVGELYVFGSILTDKFSDSSDIDFLIQFEKIDVLKYFDNYMDFKEKLEALFGREVDLLENQAIKNPILKKIIERDKKLVYERKTA